MLCLPTSVPITIMGFPHMLCFEIWLSKMNNCVDVLSIPVTVVD